MRRISILVFLIIISGFLTYSVSAESLMDLVEESENKQDVGELVPQEILASQQKDNSGLEGLQEKDSKTDFNIVPIVLGLFVFVIITILIVLFKKSQGSDTKTFRYVKQCLSKGYTKQQITSELVKSGYKKKDIEIAFKQCK